MVTTVTIAGVDVDYQSFEVDIALSPLGLAPEATIELPTRQNSVTPGDPVTITIDGATVFDGEAKTSGRIREDGRREVPCDHDGIDLFEETVTFTSTGGTDLNVLQDALAASSRGSSFTLNFAPLTTGLANDYDATDRPLKRVFRDMMGRGNNVWWVDPASNTITVEALGARGQFKALNAQTDAVAVRQFDPGSVNSVRNVVTVVGTGEERIEGSASDATSINEYGKRSETYNVEYVTTQAEADAAASQLLEPTPLDSASVIVGGSVGVSPEQNLSNNTISLTDNSLDLAGDSFVINAQKIEEGRVTLEVGEAATAGIDTINRASKSRNDVTSLGNVVGSGEVGDSAVDTPQLVDTAVIEQKLADAGVSSSKLVDGAVIEQKLADAGVSNRKLANLSVDETKIQDGSISTPKLQANAVTANEIQAFTITATEIAGRTITASEIFSETITANEIDSQTITSNKLVAGAIDTLRIAAGAVTANEIQAGSITANEISSSTITAGEIDTLDLDTGDLTVTDPVTGGKVEFFGGVNGGIAIEPTGSVSLGSPFSDPFQLIIAQQIVPENDNQGSVGSSLTAYSEMHAYQFIDATTGSTVTDGGDPLRGLSDGHGPPGSCKRHDEDGNETGHSINQMAREAWEVNRAQQRRIESLESTVESLESRLAALESQAGPNA